MAFSDWFKKYFPSNVKDTSDFLREVNNTPFQSDKLMLAFDKANVNNGMIRFNGFNCEKKTSKEIVVKSNDNKQLGKIVEGRFLALPGISNALQVSIRQAMREPSKAAVDYGRQTGNCSICGRYLNNKDSLRRGIGPICARKFGFL